MKLLSRAEQGEISSMKRQFLGVQEGEHSRPDRQERETSLNQGGVDNILQFGDDFSVSHLSRSEQQKGKEHMTSEMEMTYNRDQKRLYSRNHRMAIQEQIMLREGKTSLASEIPLGYQEGLLGGGKLTEGNWNTLKNNLETIKTSFDENDSKSSINTKLENLRKTVDKYIKEKEVDDNEYTYLDKILEKLPENASESAFQDGIRLCLGYVEDGRKP
jgi:hypothetical protein